MTVLHIQAYTGIKGVSDATTAMGYAVAYPLGIVGIINHYTLMGLLPGSTTDLLWLTPTQRPEMMHQP